MQRVKIFKSVESEITTLEEDVNQWIAESGAKVIQITGNIAPQSGAPSGSTTTGIGNTLRYPPSDIVLIVLYEAALS